MSHSHAHGPANRGRVVHTTAAPVFVCEPASPRGAVVFLHGPHGITADLESGMRTAAARGLLAVAPFFYYRDGGLEYPGHDEARDAYARLSGDDIDTDVDAATRYVLARLGVDHVCVVAAGASAPAAARAMDRHRYAASVVVDGAAGVGGRPGGRYGGTPARAGQPGTAVRGRPVVSRDWTDAVDRLPAQGAPGSG
jgi:dienelactone hydrolase